MENHKTNEISSFSDWFISRLHDRASVLTLGLTLDTACLIVISIIFFTHTNALKFGTSFSAIPLEVWQLFICGFVLLVIDIILGFKLISSLEE
jgi:hypothetical protein